MSILCPQLHWSLVFLLFFSSLLWQILKPTPSVPLAQTQACRTEQAGLLQQTRTLCSQSSHLSPGVNVRRHRPPPTSLPEPRGDPEHNTDLLRPSCVRSRWRWRRQRRHAERHGLAERRRRRRENKQATDITGGMKQRWHADIRNECKVVELFRQQVSVSFCCTLSPQAAATNNYSTSQSLDTPSHAILFYLHNFLHCR